MTDPLLQPFRLKHLNLRNRIVSTSHEPAYSVDGMPMKRYRLYHEEKARGGIALTMIGGSSVVSRDSPGFFGNLDLRTDAIVPHLRELAGGVHGFGAAIMCQITHLGRRAHWAAGDWLPVVSASSIREPAHRAFPKVIETHDMARIAADYASAAGRCQEGGLDGIEIQAYGHLFDSFWSPSTSERDDEFGLQDIASRLRFSYQVLEEIRRIVGAEFIVGLRLLIDEAMPVGLRKAEGLEIARRFADSGLVDFLSVIQGFIGSDEGLSHVIPGMGTPAGPYLDLAREVRGAIKLPIMHAARINDVATARHAIQSGAVDLVGMTRAHMADPHIVAKIMRGEEDRIRPCVGAGYCIDRIYLGGEALCLHNPATGREETMPHVIAKGEGPVRKVVVVGAGPAGLEAARVCACRGHEVVLFEAGQKPGGQILLAARVGRRRELLGIVDWLKSEVERLSVACRYGHYVEANDVLAENPDIVVVATGGLPFVGRFHEGADLIHNSWDILSGATAIAPEVLFYDDHSGHEGASTAEFLAQAGARLECVTPDRAVGMDVGGINYPAYYKALYQAKAVMTPNHRLVSVRRDGNKLVATLVNEYDKSILERRVDQIVAEHGTQPAADLYFDLKSKSANDGEIDYDALASNKPQSLIRRDGAFRLYRVGDAVSSRNIHAALFDSLRLCLQF